MLNFISDEDKRQERLSIKSEILANDSNIYLNILKNEFTNLKSPLTNFLSACSHGDTRLSLDLFSSFLLSGYTNVDEMITAGSWNFQIHQVIKPVMIPNRYFYDENLSDIPNIYQLRSNRHSSHFTGLRILRKISKGSDKTSPSYHSVAELKAYFSEVFNMLEDFEDNVDILLKHSFIEANNRIDRYTNSVDSIRVTNYGLYMINELAFNFTYLDLICTDCGVYIESNSNYLSEAAKKEYRLFTKGERLPRIKVRLDRVENFLDYLKAEELREKEFYSLEMPENEMFTYKVMNEFTLEKKRVLNSAKRQEKRSEKR